MSFRHYDHLERLGHDEVDGLTIGECYVFAKLDGTNSSVWMKDGELKAGSRNRILSLDNDNAGFCKYVEENRDKFMAVFDAAIQDGMEELTIYGEFLVPHSLKTYREDAWKKFYVFDVFDRKHNKYLPYNVYENVIRNTGLEIIEPLCKYNNPSNEQLQKEAEQNTYLILDGAGVGEGIVIKNYGWRNRFDRQPWAKIVRNEFKEENRRAFGTTEKGGEFQVEAAVAERHVTKVLVDKTRAKIENDWHSGDLARGEVTSMPRAKLIPQLLGTVFYELVREDMWEIVKTYKNPTIDFKKLQQHCIHWTKKHAADLF